MKDPVYLFTVSLLIIAQSCKLNTVDASGVVSEYSSSLGSFNEIALAGNFTFVLKSAENSSLVIKGDSAFLKHIHHSIRRNKLIVESRSKWKGAEPPVVEVYARQPISHMELAGAVKAISQRRMEADKFQVDMTGASSADLNVRANELFINQSGASHLKISGAVDTFILNSTGASYTDARNLPSRNLKTNISGASKAEVFAIDRLNVTLSGASSLKYLGSPSVKSNISGNGTLSVIE